MLITPSPTNSESHLAAQPTCASPFLLAVVQLSFGGCAGRASPRERSVPISLMVQVPRKTAAAVPVHEPAQAAAAAAPPASPDEAYRSTALDVYELSAELGAATLDDVLLLTAGFTATSLVDLGNDFATLRVTRDALRLLGVAASFLQRAPVADQHAVDLSLDVVRVGAWAAAEDARAHEALRGANASKTTRDAGAEAEARRVLEGARSEKRKLADTVRAVAQSAAVDVAVAHALAPAAHGGARPGPDVSLDLLVKQGRALVASNDASVKRRAALYRLTSARLDVALAIAEAASHAAKVLDAPKVVVTQESVDWWDGATIAILQIVVRAFQGARETHPGVPRVEFVSLRRRANAGAVPEGGGGEPK